MTTPSVAWLVGASSGIGQALAFALAQAGWQVAISARRSEPLQAMQARHPSLTPYPLDVTDAHSLHAAAAITRELGEVNYLGMVNGLDAILPLMLVRGVGKSC